MKRFKKIASLLLAVVMVLAMTVPAMAAINKVEPKPGGFTFTITGKPGHIYEVYQIFTGTLALDDKGNETAGDDEKILSDIQWGDSVTAAAQETYGEAKDKAKELTNEAEAKAFADDLYPDKLVTDPAVVRTMTEEPNDDGSESTYTLSGLAAGYYLVVDRATSLNGKEDEAYTSYIMQMVGDVDAKPKSEVPKVDKQVQDETGDAEAGATDGWGETADHETGETFQFKLTATIPASAERADYDTYMVKFKDSMSAGITFKGIVSVKVLVDGAVAKELDKGQYKIPDDLVENTVGPRDWTLEIEDLRTLVGDDITKNLTVEVIYKAQLNEDAIVGNDDENKNTVDLEYSNNPNGEGTGKATPDTVYVFTYELSGLKVEGGTEKKPLQGAGFKLYKYADDGDTKLYAKLTTNGKISEWTTSDEATEVTSDKDGKFKFEGLDVGDYWLTETTTPPGFNTMADLEIKVEATHEESDRYIPDDKPENLAGTEYTVNDADIVTVENQKGSTLPGTGGMGTTLFYIIGGVLVVGAVIVLVSKKRAAK